jgi:hypothetical protein
VSARRHSRRQSPYNWSYSPGTPLMSAMPFDVVKELR